MLMARGVLVAAICMAGGASAKPLDLPKPQIATEVAKQTPNIRFNRWISWFYERALQDGISQATLDASFANITYNTNVIDRDRNQAEFSKTLWDYLDSAVSDARIRNGRAALDRHSETLLQIEEDYGVDHEVIVAIWGLESTYGAGRGSTNVIEAMATLAYDGRRAEFFEDQLIAAFKILEAGDTSQRNMVGSWAGAMGHTQFIPTSFVDYAVDGNGDGRRDIWGDDPTDALASTANYLSEFGWVLDQPWGVEVTLPDGFDYTMARRDNAMLPSEWAKIGVTGTNGQPVQDFAPATILLPGGAQGVALMIFPNFEVLEAYNTADAYVIGVGHLADRIGGAAAFEASWPREDRALSGRERRELQQRLRDAGFDPEAIDGRIGPLTISAIRNYQVANNLVPDGYASLRLLNRLR